MRGSGSVSYSVKGGGTDKVLYWLYCLPSEVHADISGAGFSRRSSAVEHPLRKRVVGGSNPSAGTSLHNGQTAATILSCDRQAQMNRRIHPIA
jgi:hypothetical protein